MSKKIDLNKIKKAVNNGNAAKSIKSGGGMVGMIKQQFKREYYILIGMFYATIINSVLILLLFLLK